MEIQPSSYPRLTSLPEKPPYQSIDATVSPKQLAVQVPSPDPQDRLKSPIMAGTSVQNELAFLDNTPPHPLEGVGLGRQDGIQFELGAPVGRAHQSENAAVAAALRQPDLLESVDYAVVKSPDNTYQVHSVNGQGRWLADQEDADNYATLRQIRPKTHLPEGHQLTALISENHDVRYLTGEASPRRYQRPKSPPALSAPGSRSNSEQRQHVQALREQLKVAGERLQKMSKDLSSEGDHRGIFPTIYASSTQKGLAEVDRLLAKGQLREAEFLSTFCTAFANRYFDAYDTYADGKMSQVPETWRAAFDFGRQSEAVNRVSTRLMPIANLSVVAHILNDLPQTLQDIGYNKAPDRDNTLQPIFDDFNGILMHDKENILHALKTNYGNTDLAFWDTLGEYTAGWVPTDTGNLNESLQGEVFTLMRDTAKDRALNLTPAEIRTQAVQMSDRVRALTPYY